MDSSSVMSVGRWRVGLVAALVFAVSRADARLSRSGLASDLLVLRGVERGRLLSWCGRRRCLSCRRLDSGRGGPKPGTLPWGVEGH